MPTKLEEIADSIGTGRETLTRSDLKPAYPLKVHYHIRWSTSTLLDWQAFSRLTEAEAVAKHLVRGDETYSIEAFGADCKRCLFEDSLRRNAAYNNARRIA
jgi:hypothetical protein